MISRIVAGIIRPLFTEKTDTPCPEFRCVFWCCFLLCHKWNLPWVLLSGKPGAVYNANDPVIDDATNIVNGTADNDSIRRASGDPGNQRLNGLGGDDLLEGGTRADILDGGDGTDLALYNFDTRNVEIDLETGTATGGRAEGDVLISIENIASGSGNDIITGNTADNLLISNSGNDLFRFEPDEGSDRITDFGTGADRLEFRDGLFADLEAVRTAARNTGDGNLEIKLSETETLTLEGVTLAALTAETVTTLDREGKDTTTPPADANSASDAPAFELDNLLIDEEALMRLADSEGIHLSAPVEPQAPPSASEDSLSANKSLALVDPFGPPPALSLFGADLEGYSGL